MSDTADIVGRKIIGARIKRTEDPRLLTGFGSYTDDRQVARVLHVAFRRSEHAHARIVSIDCAPARAAPGVVAVLTAQDLEALARPLVALEKSGLFLLAADTVSLRVTLDRNVAPRNTQDAQALAKSWEEVRRIEARGATVLCGHDAAQWDTLRKGAEFYD